jgi:hypothetical protein
MLDLNSLDLDELAAALQDQTDYDYRWLIHRHTGETLHWTRYAGIDGSNPIALDDLDEDLVVIEPLPSWVWYRDMSDFIDELSDENAQDRLGRAIQGRGAFRRFQDVLHDRYAHLVPVWHAFRDIRGRRRVADWLSDNGLVDPDAAQQFRAEHPDPDVP